MSTQPEERSVDSSALSPVEPEEFVWPPLSADVLEPVETKPTPPEFDIPVHAPLRTPSDPLLSDILVSDVTFEWHHGVAVVQQLLAQLAPDGPPAGNVPEAWAIRLTSSGELDARLVAGPERPLAGLGTLLQQLLSGRAQPAALRLLLMQATGSDPTISLAALREGLAQWERPNRQQSLASLYDEAKGKVTPSLTRVLPMPDLVTRALAPAPPAPAEASAKKRRRRSFPAAVVLAIAGLGFTAVLIALVLITGTGTPQAPDTSDPPAQAEAAPVAEAVAEPPVVAPTSRPPAARASASNAPRAVAPPRASSPPPRAAVPSASTPPVGPAPRPPASQSRAATAATRPAGGNSTLESQVQPAVPDRASSTGSTLKPPVDYPQNTANDPAGPPIYSVSDPGVVPPVALSNLPAQPEPSAIPPRLAVLELIIDTTGQVEAARFLNSDPHYRDRWWISAAKTWRFQPARLNGQPVRFRARVTFMSGATLDPRVADR